MEQVIQQARLEDWPARKLARKLKVSEDEAQELLDNSAPVSIVQLRALGPKTAPLSTDAKIEIAASGLTPYAAALKYNCTYSAAVACIQPPGVTPYTEELVEQILRHPADCSAAEVATLVGCSVVHVERARNGVPGKIHPATAVPKAAARGLTRYQTAAALDLSYATVQKYWPERNGSKTRHDAGTRALAKELLKKHTQEEVARQLGVAQSTIHRWSKEQCSTK